MDLILMDLILMDLMPPPFATSPPSGERGALRWMVIVFPEIWRHQHFFDSLCIFLLSGNEPPVIVNFLRDYPHRGMPQLRGHARMPPKVSELFRDFNRAFFSPSLKKSARPLLKE
jgi:hypothetical protein